MCGDADSRVTCHVRLQVVLEVMAETGWACSMIDRMINVRDLHPQAPKKRKLPGRPKYV